MNLTPFFRAQRRHRSVRQGFDLRVEEGKRHGACVASCMGSSGVAVRFLLRQGWRVETQAELRDRSLATADRSELAKLKNEHDPFPRPLSPRNEPGPIAALLDIVEKSRL